MLKLTGKTWKELQEQIKEELMMKAHAEYTSWRGERNGIDCTIDFEGTPYSVAGKLIFTEEEAEIIIDDEAKIYSSSEE